MVERQLQTGSGIIPVLGLLGESSPVCPTFVMVLYSRDMVFSCNAAMLVCCSFSAMLPMRGGQICCIMSESALSGFTTSHKPLEDGGTRSVFGQKRSQSHKRVIFTACKLIPTFVTLTVSFSRFVEPQRKPDVKSHPSDLAVAENKVHHTSDLQCVFVAKLGKPSVQTHEGRPPNQ